MTFIFWPDRATADETIGGKARALWNLRSTGLAIPPWFAVTPAAFESSVPEAVRWRLEAGIDGADEAEVAALLASVTPSAAVAAATEEAAARLSPGGELLAVRSSARDEDGGAASFAGQYKSVLGVKLAAVAVAVAAVWQSAFTARVRAYRSQRGVRSETRAPAVLVQLMVRAACSGVAFGADPVSGRRDRVVVSAVPGLGVGLVQGECEADTWHLDADGRILSRQIARKTSVWRPADDGVRTEALAPDDGARPALDDARLAAVCRMVQAAGRHFQAPRDVERAIEGETIQLLQSRPITSLRDVPAESEPFAIWDNSNIVESYAGVTTPLTFSFAQRAYEGVYRQFCRPHKGSVPLSTERLREWRPFRNPHTCPPGLPKRTCGLGHGLPRQVIFERAHDQADRGNPDLRP